METMKFGDQLTKDVMECKEKVVASLKKKIKHHFHCLKHAAKQGLISYSFSILSKPASGYYSTDVYFEVAKWLKTEYALDMCVTDSDCFHERIEISWNAKERI